MEKAQIGLYGLGVMGENLARNIADKGFSVALNNREEEPGVVAHFMELHGGEGTFVPTHSVGQFIGSLERPRKILMMIRAGAPVDETMARLIPLLEEGDILIDGGNSHYGDTERRAREAEAHGMHYVGMGVSGGELGALHGPSLMPGGSRAAYDALEPILEAIAARAEDGEPCCAYVGPGGSGHFVKMVHNGIEYGDMQLICEVYDIMKRHMGLSNEQMGDLFAEWNEGELRSYLIEITRDILRYRDADGGYPLDIILDAAGQKGTGKWASVAALELGVPLTLISEAVFARLLSAGKRERDEAETPLARRYAIDIDRGDLETSAESLAGALYMAKIISYAQGFALMRKASRQYGWNLDLGAVARSWRAGCIIRSVFLDRIAEAYAFDPDLPNLMLAPFFTEILTRRASLRETILLAVEGGIPVPAMSAALSYYDGYRSRKLPANLLQAMRDYFGAHGFERIDRPRGEFFHINWTGEGGDTRSGSYQV